jgi:hypothetical protein
MHFIMEGKHDEGSHHHRRPDGAFGAYVARPKDLSAPAVVVLHEVFGVNADIRKTCDELIDPTNYTIAVSQATAARAHGRLRCIYGVAWRPPGSAATGGCRRNAHKSEHSRVAVGDEAPETQTVKARPKFKCL